MYLLLDFLDRSVTASDGREQRAKTTPKKRNNSGVNVTLGYYNNGIDYNLRAMRSEIGAGGDT